MVEQLDNSCVLSQLKSLLAPEIVHTSKVCSVFSEAFEANIDELVSANEVSKLVNKQGFIDIVPQLSFLEYDKEKGLVKIVIHEHLVAFSLVNIPFGYCADKIFEAIPFLKANQITSSHLGGLVRAYSKSILWVLVTEDTKFANDLEESLKVAEINGIKIKYERLESESIKKQLAKQIASLHYVKDSADLKSGHKNLGANNNYDSNNSQKLSWRKKSNDTTDHPTSITDNKPKQSGGFQRSSNAGAPIAVRDRYNSDGGQPSSFRPSKKITEIEIDLSKISYSLKIQHKYSNGDLLLYYDKLRIKKVFDEMPKFENYIEEICSKEKRKEFNFLKRERSLTYSLPVTYKSSKFEEVKLNLDAPSYKLPNQNPLSGGKLSGIQLNK
jgi:hypothetical protein